MHGSTKRAIVATCGLVLAAVGTFLPWARIGGRTRSGYDTADTFVALGSGELPALIAWIGRWWYTPAFLIVFAWCLVVASGRRWHRLVGVGLVLVAALLWWVFVYGADRWGRLAMNLSGPTVASAGAALIATSGFYDFTTSK